MKEEDNAQIFITKLHPRVSRRDLSHQFSRYGDIKDIRLMPGYAFVDFTRAKDARVAIEEMDGQLLEERIYKSRGDDISSDIEDKLRVEKSKGPNASDKCFNCGRIGHWANECRDRPNYKKTLHPHETTCYKCGETGHKQIRCSKRIRSRSSSTARERIQGRKYIPDSRTNKRKRKRSRSYTRSKYYSTKKIMKRKRDRSYSSKSLSGEKKYRTKHT